MLNSVVQLCAVPSGVDLFRLGALGGPRSAKILLYSVDFHEIERVQHADRRAEAWTAKENP